jgi:predicted dienelactone hydrolase
MNSSLVKYSLLFTLALLPGQTASQPAPLWQISHTNMVTFDASRGNRRIPVSVWYPSGDGGPTKTRAGAKNRFPVVLFGHGFKLSEKSYQNIVDLLVPEGFIVAFPLKERGFHPSHKDFAEDIGFVMRQFRQWDQDSTSMFYGRISPLNCAMGHSMGGGAAVLAASMEPGITSLAVLAPYNTTPSATEAARKLKIPALVIAGSLDCVTPPAEHQIPIYEALAPNDKTYLSIIGGSHCGMTSAGLLCHLAERSCRPHNVLSSREQQIILGRYLLSWLKSRVLGDQKESLSMEKLLSEETQVTWRSATSGRGHTD